MSDENMLSQDEIDALLQGDLGLDELDEEDENFGGSGAGGGSGSGQGGSGIYTAEQIRALHEVVDSCFISEINVLSEYVQQEVALSNSKTPELVTEDRLKDELLSTEHIFVTFDFEEGKSGVVLGGIPSAMIAALMTGEEWDRDPDFEWDDLKLSALQDCFNGLLGKLVPALKTATGKDFVSQQPQAIVLSGGDFPPEATLLKQSNIAQVMYDLNVGEEPNGDLERELKLWVRKQIGPIATPDHIQFAPGLPKTRSGKIMRRILRKIAANEHHNLGDTTTLADPTVVDSLIDNRKNK